MSALSTLRLVHGAAGRELAVEERAHDDEEPIVLVAGDHEFALTVDEFRWLFTLACPTLLSRARFQLPQSWAVPRRAEPEQLAIPETSP